MTGTGFFSAVQAKNPSRDLPVAILGSLSLATILYLLMALAITLMVYWRNSKIKIMLLTEDCA